MAQKIELIIRLFSGLPKPLPMPLVHHGTPWYTMVVVALEAIAARAAFTYLSIAMYHQHDTFF